MNRVETRDGILPSFNPVTIVYVDGLPAGIGRLHTLSEREATLAIQLKDLAREGFIEIELRYNDRNQPRRVRLPIDVIEQHDGLLRIEAGKQWQGCVLLTHRSLSRESALRISGTLSESGRNTA